MTFKVGDRVRHTFDYGAFWGAVPVGAEGRVIEAHNPNHIVVDFGKYGERGCRRGEYLEIVTHDQ